MGECVVKFALSLLSLNAAVALLSLFLKEKRAVSNDITEAIELAHR